MVDNPIIFLNKEPQSSNYKAKSGGGGNLNIPTRDREQHFRNIKQKFEKIISDFKEGTASSKGIYLEFSGQEGKALVSESLENESKGIRLLNEHSMEDKKDQRYESATIFIPENAEKFILKKIEEYGTTLTKRGKPKNKNLINSIEDLKLATIESLWQDDPSLIPKQTKCWCEVWLRLDDKGNKDEVFNSFFQTCKDNQIQFNQEQIQVFPERIVVLVQANKNDLETLIKTSDLLAEFRRVKETAKFWVNQSRKEQKEWIDNLLRRTTFDNSPNVSILILDTGINREHPLLKNVIGENDCLTVNDAWGVNDTGDHGTLMAGIATYGELEGILQRSDNISIFHCLESAKILSESGNANPKDSYGYQTSQGISRAEINNSDRKRIVSMAISTKNFRDRGKPSGWSSEIDKITSGYEDGLQRLMFISAGNINNLKDLEKYPCTQGTYSIHDPAQSWNAITVGAITYKNSSEPSIKTLAKPGEISPFSSVSTTWETKWPNKPDIVFEGGNALRRSNGEIDLDDNLSILSTKSNFEISSFFDATTGTSPATAYASWMAAQIQAQYPNAWPETIRALMIHSAEWNDAIKEQFKIDKETKKQNLARLLRVCGYGEPNLNKAISCMKNQFTLVSEQEIQPFTKKHLNEMHLHELPWPSSELLGLGEKEAKLKVTLSYFIEPSPGERWNDKYRYASYGLRFALKSVNETLSEFKKRVNRAIEREDGFSSDSEDWVIGVNTRNKGSIHSDFTVDTAANLANCDAIAVFPIGGWWKNRIKQNKFDKKARYSLVVSLDCLETEIDIYTAVSNKIKIPIVNKATES